MKVSFKTNLDWYRGVSWPVLDMPPREGETVQVDGASMTFCNSNKIPTRLNVVSVTYTDHSAVVDLWYRKIDIEFARVGNRMDHLYKNRSYANI